MAKGARSGSPRNLLTSLVLVFPLFLTYQIGVLYTLPMLNGADFLTTLLLRDLHVGQPMYLAFTAAVALVYLLALLVLRRTQQFNPGVIVPVVLESAIYALTMGSLIILVMTQLLGVSPKLAVPPGAGPLGGSAAVAAESEEARFVMSIGAGVWEETTFRLFLLSGLAWLFGPVAGLPRVIAVTGAFILASLAFSAMHHVGVTGDPLRMGVFTFRFLAGVCFGLLYWFRGFAVAVYTHALYDVYVLLIR